MPAAIRTALRTRSRYRPARYRALTALAMLLVGLPVAAADWPAGGRLPGTGGVTQLEGAAGGGLVPWALIAGYGTRDETGGSVFYTAVNIDDFTLASRGLAVGFYDRLELSFAEQRFGLGDTVPGEVIRMDTLGLKLKLAGDAVFDQDRWLPQLALGLQYKRNRDMAVPTALGARADRDVDAYLAASKLWLAGPLGRTLLANLTLRATRANQLGLLGFGGDRERRHRLMSEASLAVLLHDRLAVGVEYRQKPDNLSVFAEDDFADAFIAWFPHKRLSLTVAVADLGNIANQSSQQGGYLSLQLNH